MEFEIIDKTQDDDQVMGDAQEEEEDFDFPLFSMGTTTTTAAKPEEQKDQEEESLRGRTQEKQNTMRITLRSPSPEVIIQERPRSYYFAENDEEVKAKFAQAAITGDDVIRQSLIPYGPIGKVINLNEHNAKIEKELEKINKKARPGKKKRLASIKAREHNKERLKIQKQIEQKAKAKLMKKIHHKRGGKKHKKKEGASDAQGKTKYRTERMN